MSPLREPRRAARDGARSLAGVRVVVTRAAHQAPPTVLAFEEAGAAVELLPLLEVVPPEDSAPLDAALGALGTFAWVVFTSSNAAERVLSHPAWPAAQPPGLHVASVGGATSEALRNRGVEPDLEAADPRAEGLADAVRDRLAAGGGAGRGSEGSTGRTPILLPQASDARPVLAEELTLAGARVERVDAYAKRTPPEAPERARQVFGRGALGWVTFTSPSTARRFADLWGDDWPSRRRTLLAASIGPVTSDALRELGVEPAAQAERPGDRELVAAVARALAARGAQ
ncbi:MAG: uroporphyrinogen-III synthase [Thermoanaerobaculia bacterium]